MRQYVEKKGKSKTVYSFYLKTLREDSEKFHGNEYQNVITDVWLGPFSYSLNSNSMNLNYFVHLFS